MEACSLDLRQRICAACDEGIDTRQEVAERFGVGRWFVQKLLRQRRLERSIAPKPRGRGPAPTIGPAQQRRVRELLKAKPDATLAELCRSLRQAEAAAGGVWVSVATMCRTLKALRLPLKKRRCTPASGIRRACGRALRAGTSRSKLRRWIQRDWSSLTKVGSTRR